MDDEFDDGPAGDGYKSYSSNRRYTDDSAGGGGGGGGGYSSRPSIAESEFGGRPNGGNGHNGNLPDRDYGNARDSYLDAGARDGGYDDDGGYGNDGCVG